MPELTIAECAIAIHEMFVSYIAAGFTSDQALYLTGVTITDSARGGK